MKPIKTSYQEEVATNMVKSICRGCEFYEHSQGKQLCMFHSAPEDSCMLVEQGIERPLTKRK